MGEQITNGDRCLAICGKLRPVVCDRRVVFDFAFCHQLMKQGCRHTLGGGEGNAEGIFLPGIAMVITDATPKVNHLATTMVDADGAAAGAFWSCSRKAFATA